MKITNGIIFIWTGTHASIPSGWSRVTSMDDKYPKGTADATNPNTTGGNATHTHTSPTHTHTNAAHTHTMSTAAATGYATTGTPSTGAMPGNHSHNNSTSGAVASFSCSSVAATYGSVSNDPTYHGVIYITPTTSVSIIPTGVICLADQGSISGYNKCDGTGDTPNLVGKFLKGATTGADAGTTGGSTTNIHALSHTHTTSHQHAAAATGSETPTTGADSASGSSYMTAGHTHSITLPAATPSSVDDVNLTTTETVEPAYTKLIAMKATSDNAVGYGIIALWLGTLANIPRGWVLCDGSNGTVDMRGRHLKITATAGEIGNAGGSNTHTHASQNHNHSISHSHSTSVNHSGFSMTRNSNGSSRTITSSSTSHAISTDSVNLVLSDSSTTADSSNNEPPYRTVAYIKLRYFSNPAIILMKFFN